MQNIMHNITGMTATVRYQVEYATEGKTDWNQVKPALEIEEFARAIAREQRLMDIRAGLRRDYRLTTLTATHQPLFEDLEPTAKVETAAPDQAKARDKAPVKRVKKERVEKVKDPVHGHAPARAPRSRDFVNGPSARIRAILPMMPAEFKAVDVHAHLKDIELEQISKTLYSLKVQGAVKLVRDEGLGGKWYAHSNGTGKVPGIIKKAGAAAAGEPRPKNPALAMLGQIHQEIRVPRDADAGNY